MFFLILIVVFSLIALITLHELGHFILAKKFGVKVEEFGIGIPPRIFGRKIGETLYSLNLLPIGAFVKLYGEEKMIKEPRSFTGKPILQRTLIILGGVISFWIVAAIILSIIAGIWGLPTAVSDETNHNLINPKVQIGKIFSGSPAEKSGLKLGDTIIQLKIGEEQLEIDKMEEIIKFTEAHKGKEITLNIQRGSNIFETSLIPRVSPPEGEGPMGVGLIRTALKPYPWYEAPVQGTLLTGRITILIPLTLSNALVKAVKGEPVKEVEFRGPVGIVQMLAESAEAGIHNFLYLISLIAIFLAVFNILPIPALDGGKLLFLGIEKIKGRPVNQKIEQNITTAFFALLIALMIWVTIKDIIRIF